MRITKIEFYNKDTVQHSLGHRYLRVTFKKGMLGTLTTETVYWPGLARRSTSGQPHYIRTGTQVPEACQNKIVSFLLHNNMITV